MDVWLALLGAALLFVSAVIYLWHKGWTNNSTPQLPEMLFVGHVRDFWGKDFEKAFIKHWKGMESHDLFRLRKLNEDAKGTLVMRNLDWIKMVLADSTQFPKSLFLESMLPILSGSLISMNGKAHHQLRIELGKAFTPDCLRRYIPTFSKAASDLCKKWRSDIEYSTNGSACLVVQPRCQDFTFDVICETAFGYRLSSQSDGRVDAKVSESFRRLLQGGLTYKQQLIMKYFLPFLPYMPFGPGKQMRDAARALEDLMWKIFRKRKEDVDLGVLSEEERHNILSILLENHGGNCGLSDKEIVSNVFLFLLAGHETTSTALTWALHASAKNPEVQERLVIEMGALIPRPTEATYDKLVQLQYLDCFVKETLRLYCPVDTVSRRAAMDCQLGAYRIKKGTMVQCLISCFHRDERFYNDPEAFNPDRFLKGGNTKTGAFLAFSYGPQDCIGKRFAVLELKVALLHILTSFRVEPDPAFKEYVTEFPVTRISNPPVSVKLSLRR